MVPRINWIMEFLTCCTNLSGIKEVAKYMRADLQNGYSKLRIYYQDVYFSILQKLDFWELIKIFGEY